MILGQKHGIICCFYLPYLFTWLVVAVGFGCFAVVGCKDF